MPNKKTIIAIIGMAGSGKTEVIAYLEKKYSWPKIYLGAATFERMDKEGLVLNYKNERMMREKIRKEMGMGAYAILALPKIKQACQKSNVILIESLYSWAEYKILRQKYKDTFKVVNIFASPETRFKRLKKRLKRPMKNLREFEERDFSEIENLEKGGPIARADYTIINEGNTQNLKKQVDLILKNIFKK
ncbi:MAG: AAA family ATPase [Planctomycetes bacterium]|jgi:dephospho-CoA kinase|nr:AAA family ATPase [Planctomycetota bacterium]